MAISRYINMKEKGIIKKSSTGTKTAGTTGEVKTDL